MYEQSEFLINQNQNESLILKLITNFKRTAPTL